MPNKSDSAGKLHQYYTCKAIKEIFPEATINSPLNNSDLRNTHENQFINSELLSLKIIGKLSAEIINNDVACNIISIEDIGSFSGANRIDITDDILVCADNDHKIGYSLKSTKGSIGQILSRNMGANSLIKQYFNSEENQDTFSKFLNIERIKFLNKILNTNFKEIKDAVNNIRQHSAKKGYTKARFEYYPNANEPRNIFLNSLRDKLFEILVKKIEVINIIQACNLILDSGKKHILASYKGKSEKAELKIIRIQTMEDYKDISNRGNDSVLVLLNDYEIGFRYKFESDITSNIKLVGDYH